MVVDLRKESIGFYKEFLLLDPLFRFAIVLEFRGESVEILYCPEIGFFARHPALGSNESAPKVMLPAVGQSGPFT
jgi:hypothetical protein